MDKRPFFILGTMWSNEKSQSLNFNVRIWDFYFGISLKVVDSGFAGGNPYCEKSAFC